MRNPKERAAWWYRTVQEKYPEEIQDSINRSKVYRRGPIGLAEPAANQSIHLRRMDAVSCLASLGPTDGKVCILNYASYKTPGGSFLNGALSQEEALCHESTLYPVLEARLKDYYIPNRSDKNRALYRNKAIYSPDIIFIHKGKEYKCDVLTCAAPNWGAAYKFVNYEENLAALESRIDFMCKVCQDQGVQALIAGAWGCGVFRQDPKIVCQTFIENTNRPVDLYLAIPDEHNFYEFKTVLDERLKKPTHYI